VEPRYKGAVTSLVVFFRTIGSALGVTVFGVIQSHSLQSLLKPIVPAQFAQQLGDGRGLLVPEVRDKIPAEALAKMLKALAESITDVFTWSILLPVVALLAALLMGKARLQLAGRGPQGEQGHDGTKAQGERPSFSME
jgi:hypothetical protein